MIRIHTDAAVNQKQQKAGVGLVIVGEDLYEQISIPIPYEQVYNNHTLEFKALIYALRWVIEHNYTDQMIFLHTDSKVAYDVVDKGFTKNDLYQSLLEEIKTLIKVLPLVTVQWVPEKQNRGADNLAKQALNKI